MNTALSAALLHFIWQGAAIACLFALALVFAKSARVRYGLACLALLAMPVAFAITFVMALPPAPLPMRVPGFFTIPPTVDGGSAITMTPSTPFDPSPFWMAGVTMLYGYRFLGWLAAQRLRQRGVCSAPGIWQSKLVELSAKIRLARPVALLESALAETPMTIGMWKPVILLPLGLLAGLPGDQVEAILLHELAHIRRHDYLVNLLQAVVEGLLFYHPATWWVSRTIRREREMCCDDLASQAAGDVRTYVQALASLEAQRVRVPILAASGGPLMSRIHRLLDRQTPVSHTAPALLFLVLATGAALFAFQPPAPPKSALPPVAPAPPATPTPQAAPAPQTPPAPQAATQPAAPPYVPVAERARQAYEKWMDQEVVWIISPEERTAFRRLGTDEERQMFIEQFWLRRDPTPDTRENELMEEHYRRVAWANDHYTATIPGWQTDRGMIYVKYGPPDEKESHPQEDGTFPYEKWLYRHLEGVGSDVVLEFVDRAGDGNYRMTWDPNTKDVLLQIPAAGKTLYQQIGPQARTYQAGDNIFDRLQRFVSVHPLPTR
jgi:GWxTD domain-containing protein